MSWFSIWVPVFTVIIWLLMLCRYCGFWSSWKWGDDYLFLKVGLLGTIMPSNTHIQTASGSALCTVSTILLKKIIKIDKKITQMLSWCFTVSRFSPWLPFRSNGIHFKDSVQKKTVLFSYVCTLGHVWKKFPNFRVREWHWKLCFMAAKFQNSSTSKIKKA